MTKKDVANLKNISAKLKIIEIKIKAIIDCYNDAIKSVGEHPMNFTKLR
jgi:hypothetical protein